MLKELFESCFYVTFPVKSGYTVNLTETTHNGDFALKDANACRKCRFVCDSISENQKQLLIRSVYNVNIIEVNDIFAPIKENLGEMCDYILDDNNKFVLVEMTCSTKDYVGSKRVKCIGQLYNTLTILRTCGPIRMHIENEKEREAIFSWKETHEPADMLDIVEISMTAMTDMGDDVYSPYNISSFEDGFKYREIRYPDTFIW